MMRKDLKFKGDKREPVKRLILKMVDVFEQIGISLEGCSDRRLEMMAMTTLAVGGIKHSFHEAKDVREGRAMKTRDIIEYINDNFGENVSRGSYDDIRRKYLIMQVENGCVISTSALQKKATNDPTRGYSLSPSFAKLLKAYGLRNWKDSLRTYYEERGLEQAKARELESKTSIEVVINEDVKLKFTAGEHNTLQKLIIEQFLPRFGMEAELLYVGDAADKFLYVNNGVLEEIGFFRLAHEELPDVVAFSRKKNLLFLIEAVHSTGPMGGVRVGRLERQLKSCSAVPIFVSAFLNRKVFRRFLVDIAWETEVWLADEPEHLIHFNGYKFLEIHKD